MENKMPEVAKLLGLELEEEFRIKNSNFRYKLSKEGFMFWSDYNQDWFYISKLEQLLIGYCEIIKIPKPILDEVEKKYLSAMIKPFSKYVKYICKRDYKKNERITIYYHEYVDNIISGFSLPSFKKGTMYKGMQIGKRYTVKELGL